MYRFKEWLKTNKSSHNDVKAGIYELMQMAYNAGQGDADVKEYYDCDTEAKLQAENKRLREYVKHKEDCKKGKYVNNLEVMFGMNEHAREHNSKLKKHGCTCGLEQALTGKDF